MKSWVKGGLIGFIVAFVGLWIILFASGNDPEGWKCTTLGGAEFCTFTQFLFSPIHIVFVLVFSWIGFFGGVIDTRIIKKIVKGKGSPKVIPLKITSTVMLTLIIVFAIIGLLVFDNWVGILVDAIIFTIFILIVSWAVGKWKYRR